MKLKKFLCLFLLLAVVFATASCAKISFGKKYYTVTFNTDGGSEVASQTVKSGEKATAPADPTKEGYTFVGWYNGDIKWDFEIPVSENTTLVARWNEIPEENPGDHEHTDADGNGVCDTCGEDLNTTYKITYVDGWKKLALEPSTYTVNTTELTLPTPPEKDYYVFDGWYLDSEFTKYADKIDVSYKSDITYYAKYLPVSYTITYNLDGGTNAPENLTTYNVTNLPFTLAEPAKDNYVFRGWYTDYACTEPITEITKNTIGNYNLYAKWASPEQIRTVTYLDMDGNEIAVESFYISGSDQPLREGPVVEDYEFIGWVDANDESVTYSCIPAGTDTDLVLKANMKCTIVHRIHYWINDVFFTFGTFEQELGLDEIPVFNKGGYDFDGWYSDVACTEKVTSIPANTLCDVILYGKHIPGEYTIEYYDGETKLELNPSSYFTSPTATSLPEIPEKEGHYILGWYTAEGVKVTEIEPDQYGNLVLYAKYEKHVYTIHYTLFGGENSDKNVTEYRHDELPTLHDPEPRSGYSFEGWYDNPNFSGVPMTDLSKYLNQDVVIYAKWSPILGEGNETLTPEVPF